MLLDRQILAPELALKIRPGRGDIQAQEGTAVDRTPRGGEVVEPAGPLEKGLDLPLIVHIQGEALHRRQGTEALGKPLHPDSRVIAARCQGK